MVDWLAGKRIKGTSTERTASFIPSVGGWVELGRTTLGSANSDITVSSLANKRYYMYLADIKGQSSNADGMLRYNSDPTLNYANRGSDIGNTDAITINQSQIQVASHTGSMSTAFDLGYIANLSTKEKLNQSWSVSTGSGGAGAAPYRWEGVGKWANISDSINTINFKTNASQTWNTGSEVVVLGWDPADTHTSNFWTELASVTTLTTGNVDSGTFTAKKYLWIQFELIVNDFQGTGVVIQFNADTLGNYANRINQNGVVSGDGINVSQTSIGTTISGGKRIFGNMFIINNSANEKLVIGHTVVIGTTANSTAEGATVAPRRVEFVGKWANITSQITKIVLDDTASNFVSGQIKVWGSN